MTPRPLVPVRSLLHQEPRHVETPGKGRCKEWRDAFGRLVFICPAFHQQADQSQVPTRGSHVERARPALGATVDASASEW